MARINRARVDRVFTVWAFVGWICFTILWNTALITYPYKIEPFSPLSITLSEMGRYQEDQEPRVYIIFNANMILAPLYMTPLILVEYHKLKQEEGVFGKVMTWISTLSGELTLIMALLIGVFHLDGPWGNHVHDCIAYTCFAMILLWMLSTTVLVIVKAARKRSYPSWIAVTLMILSIVCPIIAFAIIGCSEWWTRNFRDNWRIDRPEFKMMEWCLFLAFTLWMLFYTVALVVPKTRCRRGHAEADEIVMDAVKVEGEDTSVQTPEASSTKPYSEQSLEVPNE